MLFTLVMQYIIIQFGGEFTSTTPLTLNEWLLCIFIGSLGLPVGALVKMIPLSESQPRKP